MNRVTILALAAAASVGFVSVGCKSESKKEHHHHTTPPMTQSMKASADAPAGELRLGAGDQVGESDQARAKSVPQVWAPKPDVPPANVSAGNDQAAAAAALASNDQVKVTASGDVYAPAANTARPSEPRMINGKVQTPAEALDQVAAAADATANAAQKASDNTSAILANAAESAKTARAEIMASKAPGMDDVKGVVEFVAVPDGVKVVYDIKGLGADSKHGFHIHEKGDLSDPDLKSAGGHFNPDKHKHGGPEGDMRHGGDLGNITADDKGEAKGEVMAHGVTLTEGEKGILGRSVIVHEKADDMTTDPAGNSGARIAGGVIKAGGEAPAGEKDAGNAKKE